MLLATLLAAKPAQPQARDVQWETIELARSRGRTDTVRFGRLSVPQQYGKPASGDADIAFAVLPGTGRAAGAPIVYLDGGPGGNGLGVARVPAWDALLARLRESGDVILFSQRGTSGTRARPTCAPRLRDLPTQMLLNRDSMLSTQRALVAACARDVEQRGLDLDAFSTQQSADDVDALRRALGVSQLRLLAFSYGTHLALSVMRRHPGIVERAVLVGTEGPDDTWKLPSTFDRQLRRISPDFAGEVSVLLQQLDAHPIDVQARTPDGRTVTIPVGRDGLRYLLRRDLGDTNDTAMLQALVRETLAGEYGRLRTLVERRYGGLFPGSLMPLATDCASAASGPRIARIRSETVSSILGEMTNEWFPEVCETLGVEPLPADFRAPLQSEIPTLFISGSMDANTPPFQAFDVSFGWPGARYMIVAGAGHESTIVPEVADAVVAFLKGDDVTSQFVGESR